MKIEDLIQLLNNRLREFQLSRDYARMGGDLERMNVADKEILGLEDTLFQLNLLVDTSKSAAIREDILSEVMTDGSVSVLGEYDITVYATDPLHEKKIMTILSNMAVMNTAEDIEEYIRGKYMSSPVTGEMVMSAALAYSVDARLMMAIMEQDSRFGTVGLAVSTVNPGNVGNDDDGNTRTYDSWQEGVTAVAAWLSRHRGSTPISETPEEIDVEPLTTLAEEIPVITSTTTATSTTTTSTTTTATTTPVSLFTEEAPITSTTTPATSEVEAPIESVETESAATSTPPTEEEISTITSTTTTTSTTTPESLFTDGIPVSISTTTSTTTPSTATSTPN